MSLENKLDVLNKNIERLIRVLESQTINTIKINQTHPNSQDKPRLIPVTKWNDYHDHPPIGGLRNMIFNRESNGFDLYKVVVKVRKRVLIDETNYFKWATEYEGNNTKITNKVPRTSNDW